MLNKKRVQNLPEEKTVKKKNVKVPLIKPINLPQIWLYINLHFEKKMAAVCKKRECQFFIKLNSSIYYSEPLGFYESLNKKKMCFSFTSSSVNL